MLGGEVNSPQGSSCNENIMKNKKSSPKKLKTIERDSILNKSKVEYGDRAINHVLGCGHQCSYCYAKAQAICRKNVKDCIEWAKPKIVSNILELMDQRLPKLKNKIKSVFLSFMTDPFMVGFPEIADLSLKIIEKVNSYDLISIVLTKGLLPEELGNKEKYGSNNFYGITLVSTNEEFRKIFEPGSSRFSDRIAKLRYLHDKGCKTWVSIEPFFPHATNEQDISELLKKIKFVDKIIFGRLNHDPRVTKFVKDNPTYYPGLVKKVKEFCIANKIDYLIKKGTIDKFGENSIPGCTSSKDFFLK